MKARIEQRKKGERKTIVLLTLELREVAEWRGRRSLTTRPSHQEKSCTLKCTQSTRTLDPGNYIFFIFPYYFCLFHFIFSSFFLLLLLLLLHLQLLLHP